MKKAELEAEVIRLRDHVAALGRRQFRETHKHDWSYQKSVHESPESGRSTLWQWTCMDEQCDSGAGATNTLSHVPDHFPAELR